MSIPDDTVNIKKLVEILMLLLNYLTTRCFQILVSCPEEESSLNIVFFIFPIF